MNKRLIATLCMSLLLGCLLMGCTADEPADSSAPTATTEEMVTTTTAEVSAEPSVTTDGGETTGTTAGNGSPSAPTKTENEDRDNVIDAGKLWG